MSTKMADGRHLVAANAIFLSLSSLAAAFQLCGLMLIYLILERLRIQRMGLEAANRYNNCCSSFEAYAKETSL